MHFKGDFNIGRVVVNVQHPKFCHVRCELTPSMKAGLYHVTMLLAHDGDLAIIESATCECVAGYVWYCSVHIHTDNYVLNLSLQKIGFLHSCIRSPSCAGVYE